MGSATIRIAVLLPLGILCCTVGRALAGGSEIQDPPDPWLTGAFSLEVTSRYIQSGNDSAHGSPVFSDDFELDAYDFSLGLASHVAFQKTYQEADAYLDHTAPLGPVNVSVGYVYAYIVHGPEKSLHDFYAGVSLPFAKYYSAALNGEADVTRQVGCFGELLVTAKYPVIKDKLVVAPYAGAGYEYGFTSGAVVGASGGVERFGCNVPITLSTSWQINFQVETVFSSQLDGQVWFGTRLTYNF